MRFAKIAGSKRLAYTGFRGGRGHLKIQKSFRGERFESVRGECGSRSYRRAINI